MTQTKTLPLFFLLLSLSLGLPLQNAFAEEERKPYFTFENGDIAEGEVDGHLAFESIAGTLQIPGEKIAAIWREDGSVRLSFIDGSTISGTLPDTLSCRLFIGVIDVPKGKVQKFERVKVKPKFQDPSITPGKLGPNDFKYIVIKGDSLKSIATTFITTLDKLKAKNPGINDNNLKPGMEIIIPPLD